MTDMTGYHMTCDAFADRLADYLEGDASEAVREAMETHAAVCESCGPLLDDLLAIPQQAAALPALAPSRDLWAGIAERIDARVLPMDAPRPTTIAPLRRRAWVRPAAAAAALVLFTAGVTHMLTRLSMRSTPISAVASAPVAPRQVAATAPASAVDAEISSTATERPDESREAVAPAATRRDATPSAPRARSSAPAARTNAVRLVSAGPELPAADPVYDREISKLRRIVRDRHSQLDPATIAVLEQSVAVIDSAIAQSRAALAKDPASGFLANQLNHSLEKKVELLRTAALLPSRS